MGNEDWRLSPAEYLDRMARRIERYLRQDFDSNITPLCLQINDKHFNVKYSSRLDSMSVEYATTKDGDKVIVKLADFFYEHYNPKGMVLLEKMTLNNM